MKLEADSRISFPRPLVFATYRDRLPELVPHLPDIKSITVQKREDAGAVSKLTNLWVASSEIPKVAQAIIKPEMLQWLDYATWNADDWTVEWRVETKLFTDNIKCSGKNQYIDHGSSTTLQIRGDLTIDLKGVPGVPRLLAGTIAPAVEKFVIALLKPNLLSVATGLQKFLEAEARKQNA
jgi:hypothetical protein